MRSSISFAPSSNIEAMSYDGATQELLVCFKTGANFLYRGVDDETANGLANAESAGKYLKKFVIDQCEAIPVDRDGHPI